MLDQELRESGFPDTWDNTMRTQVQECPRKFYYFMRGFDYSKRPAYFVWGSAWQEILAAWYQNPHAISDPTRPEYYSQKYLALQAGLDLWDESGVEDAGVNKRASLEILWDAYLEHYPFEEWTLVERGAEAGWVWPLSGTPWFLGGSMDGYIDWPAYGKLVLENKTDGGYLSDNYLMGWSFSPQVTGYIWALSQMLPPGEVYGCLMNMATKNVPGPRSNWSTPRFKRSIQRRSALALQEFENHARWQLALVKREFWDPWFWPRCLDHRVCAGGAGKAPCLFKAICLSDADPTLVSASDYPYIVEREGKWEPWNREGGQE